MTDIAQSLAGPLLHAKTKSPGTARRLGKPIATVESGKYVGPVKSPVTGEITKVNEALAGDAGLINRSPYRDGWIVEMSAENLAADLAEMVTGDDAVTAYTEKIEIYGSNDLKNFSLIDHKNFNKSDKDLTIAKESYQYKGAFAARYVKLIATNMGTCPDWHPGKEEQAWLFVDEIVIK